MVLKKTKIFNSDGIQLHDTQITKYIEDSGYKHIRVLEAERFKREQLRMQEYKRRLKFVLKSS